MIKILKSLKAQEITFNTRYEENVWCEINLKGKDKLLIRCMYQSESESHENNGKLNEMFKEDSTKGHTHMLIMRDFNCKGIVWDNWSTPGLSELTEEFRFIEALRDCYLYQHVDRPTRVRHGQIPSILDLVMTNEEGMIEDIEYLSLLGKSDHIISFDFKCYTQQSAKDKIVYNYGKGNYDAMKTELGGIN